MTDTLTPWGIAKELNYKLNDSSINPDNYWWVVNGLGEARMYKSFAEKPIQVKHLLSDNEKISEFHSRDEFFKFVHKIADENYDNVRVDNVYDGMEYILDNCPNLQIIDYNF